MPYVVKRYANRKLYDTRTKRYLTLDEVAAIVRAGEDVKVEDADSGDDLTAQVLTRIIAEGHRKGGSGLLPPKILVDLIQAPTEAVKDVVRTGVSAGQRTVETVSGEVGRLFDSVTGRDVPTREEFDRLEARVSALESKTRRATAIATRRKVTQVTRKKEK